MISHVWLLQSAESRDSCVWDFLGDPQQGLYRRGEMFIKRVPSP